MLNIYIASSFRNVNLVHSLIHHFKDDYSVNFFDWTRESTPPPKLNTEEKRRWFDSDKGGEIFTFCKDSVMTAELVIYLGDSGKDACLELGMAYASDTPIIGLAGKLETTGLMLNGAVDLWVESFEELIDVMEKINFCYKESSFHETGRNCKYECPLYKTCSLMHGEVR